MKTKKIAILVITLFIVSCNKENEIRKLEKKITKLKMENFLLLDSIEKIKLNKLESFLMQVTSKDAYLKKNETNKLSFSFFTASELPKYRLYLIETINGKKNETLIHKDFTEPQFEYNYKPKKEYDKIEFQAKFFLSDKILVMTEKIELPYRK